MWAIKILKGPKVGQVIQLHTGQHKVGRAESCQIQIASQGVSKEHALFSVSDSEVKIQDLNSRNGTFVNGVKVKTRTLKKNDRINFHDVIVELVDSRAALMSAPTQQSAQGLGQNYQSGFDGNAALNLPSAIPHSSSNVPTEQVQARTQMHAKILAEGGVPQADYDPRNFNEVVKNYFETVVLPGIYKLAQNFEFKWVIGSFVIAFVIAVTILSVIPMLRVMTTSLERESQRRALTIAQGMADRYNLAIANGTTGSFDTRFAEREEGVAAAFILNASDGSIVAPVSRSGAYANEPFVHTARKKEETWTQQLDSSMIGASVPIRLYDPENGLQSTKFYAMVIYNMGSLAVDDGRVISLFTQVLAIAIVVGIFLFIFLYRIIEVPISNLTLQVDLALKDGSDRIESPYKFPALQNLIVNINSALARIGDSSASGGSSGKDIYSEGTQIVRIMTNPALSVDAQGNIIAINSMLAGILNISLQQLDGSNINNFPDPSIATVGVELIQQALAQNGGYFTSAIHFQNRDLEFNLQSVSGNKGIDYLVLTLTEPGGNA